MRSPTERARKVREFLESDGHVTIGEYGEIVIARAIQNAVKEEREACARVAEDRERLLHDFYEGEKTASEAIAAAIRERAD